MQGETCWAVPWAVPRGPARPRSFQPWAAQRGRQGGQGPPHPASRGGQAALAHPSFASSDPTTAG